MNILKEFYYGNIDPNGKFAKNDKLSFISDDMLIVGCDKGSETHYIRAIDVRGRELSKGAFKFSNIAEGFESAKAWVLAAWMIMDKISVVQVNPYAVKQSKEIEDNSQLKDDRKDSKLTANLVKDGNYGMLESTCR